MATMMRNVDGNVVCRNLRREPDGLWGVTVWFGGWNGIVTNIRRYHYATRDQAQHADISHDIGEHGRKK